MDLIKDFLERDIKIGDSVIVQDKARITLGKVSHYSAAGNVIVYAHTNYKLINLDASIWKRVIQGFCSSNKIIITEDEMHLQFTSDIKIRGDK